MLGFRCCSCRAVAYGLWRFRQLCHVRWPSHHFQSFSISVKVQDDGYAVLVFGDERYIYYGDEYEWGADDRGYYYQFPVKGGLLTVFDDGSEAIYSQDYPLLETHYYYNIY